MKTTLLALAAACGLTGAAAAQSTAFTYQGRLKNGAAPASGLHDFRFRLFTAAAGGVQVGATLCADNVTVSEGLFTTPIDFGQQFATPDPRFLEVEVRADSGLNCATATGFVVLTPRQPLTAAPIANHARSAFSLAAADGSPANAVFVDNSGNVGIGTTTPLANLDVRTTGQGVRIQGALPGVNNGAYLAFANGVGTDLGYIGDGSSGDNSMYLTSYANDIHLYTAVGAALTAKSSGNVGIGTTAPIAKLHVVGGARFDGTPLDTLVGPSGKLEQYNSAGQLLSSVGFIIGPSNVDPLIGVYNPAGGAARASIRWDSFENRGEVSADVKFFRVPNPNDAATDIRYACIEGPEAAMYVRGKGRLVNGRATITLPDHFRALAAHDSLTLILTPCSFASSGLAYEVAGGRIVVGELNSGRGNYEFDWEAKAVRKGYEDFCVTRPWDELLPAGADRNKAWQQRLGKPRP